MAKITKDTLISELMEKYPETIETLFNLGLHCLGCHAGAFESLGNGLLAHGLSEEDVDVVIKELNKVVKDKKVVEKKPVKKK